ncbi:MAG: hypothetical protein KAR79_03445 [Simkaniaceae bacterium]|nr:hypothetical protein [Simkaniaceae bacterium]
MTAFQALLPDNLVHIADLLPLEDVAPLGQTCTHDIVKNIGNQYQKGNPYTATTKTSKRWTVNVCKVERYDQECDLCCVFSGKVSNDSHDLKNKTFPYGFCNDIKLLSIGCYTC